MEKSSGQEHRVYQSRVDKSGRIVLPAEIRTTLGVGVGDSVLVIQEGMSVGIVTPQQALRQAQEYFMKLAPPSVSMVDELIQEHREEAKRE
jgi:AbrB family looped-hinge helix DNA binding protein